MKGKNFTFPVLYYRSFHPKYVYFATRWQRHRQTKHQQPVCLSLSRLSYSHLTAVPCTKGDVIYVYVDDAEEKKSAKTILITWCFRFLMDRKLFGFLSCMGLSSRVSFCNFDCVRFLNKLSTKLVTEIWFFFSN